MPTGYTYKVQEGKVTELKDFVLQCSRAFIGSMRDDPDNAIIPRSIKPDTEYYDERINSCYESLENVLNLTAEELDQAAELSYNQSLSQYKEDLETKRLQKSRYQSMLDKVSKWEPGEDLYPLKNFMVDQLNTSIDHDCCEKYILEPVKISGLEWRNKNLKC